MKKVRRIILLMAVTISMLTGCSSNTSEAEKKEAVSVKAESDTETVTLNVAYMPNYGSLWAIENAIYQGYLKEENITVNLVEFQDGASIIDALVKESVDVGYIGQGAHKLVISGDAVIFALSHISNADALLAQEGITSIEQLAGQKVAYTPETSSEDILVKSLALGNMTIDDIEAISMEAEAMVGAMKSEGVAACATWSPYTMRIQEEMPEAVKLADNLTFIDESVSLSSWITTGTYAEENRDVVVRFTRALFKAMDYAAGEHQKETAALIADRVQQEGALVYDQRGDAMWLTGKEVAQGAADGMVEGYYENQKQNFVESGAVQETPEVEEYVMLDIMVEAGEY